MNSVTSLPYEVRIFKEAERLIFPNKDGYDYILLFRCETPDGNDVLITNLAFLCCVYIRASLKNPPPWFCSGVRNWTG